MAKKGKHIDDRANNANVNNTNHANSDVDNNIRTTFENIDTNKDSNDSDDDLFFGDIKRTLSNKIDVETVVKKVIIIMTIITIIIIVIIIIIITIRLFLIKKGWP